MSHTIWLPWQRPLPSNGALNSLQLWASGGRTYEPILIKFGTQQHVRTRTTVTWLNIKIFIIQNGGRPPYWKYIRNAITRLPMDRLGRNLGGHIPSCPRHVRRDAVSMATAAAYQRRIEHSAVMGVWRPKAWTNFEKNGTQQHVRTRTTVTWLNIKIFKIQNGGRPPCWKIV